MLLLETIGQIRWNYTSDNKGILSDTNLLRLALSSDEGAEKAFASYWQHVLPRYGLQRSYENDPEVLLLTLISINVMVDHQLQYVVSFHQAS